jgi:hypothetical protein
MIFILLFLQNIVVQNMILTETIVKEYSIVYEQDNKSICNRYIRKECLVLMNTN